jgi:hypothetical protein
MNIFASILPEKELLTPEDLVASGLYDNVSQVLRSVDNGMPGIKLSFRSIKFARTALLSWLEQQTTSKKQPKKKKTTEAVEASPF